jgi:hypothetical protein
MYHLESPLDSMHNTRADLEHAANLAEHLGTFDLANDLNELHDRIKWAPTHYKLAQAGRCQRWGMHV